jgi:hypothetical protein
MKIAGKIVQYLTMNRLSNSADPDFPFTADFRLAAASAASSRFYPET